MAQQTRATQATPFFVEFPEDSYLRENFQFSISSRKDLRRLVKHCAQKIERAVGNFRLLVNPLITAMSRELESARFGDVDRAIEYTARLRAAIRLMHDIKHSSAEMARNLQIIAETLDIDEVRESEVYGGAGLQFAWTTFLWIWGGWRTDCEPVITELTPALEHLNSWTPPTRKSRAVCFRLFGVWCEQLARGRLEYPDDWFLALRRVNREAFEWAGALRRIRRDYQ